MTSNKSHCVSDDPGKNEPAFEQRYLELAKLSQESINSRRDAEWKVNFGFWTLIGLLTWFLAENPRCISDSAVVWLAVVYLSATVVWVFFWQGPLHHAYTTDKSWKHHYAARAVGLYTPNRPEEEKDSCLDRFWAPTRLAARKPWFWGQVLMTVVFLLSSWYVISSAKSNSSALLQRDSKAHLSISGEDVRFVLEKIAK